MSQQQQDVIEQKGPNQVVHIRSDSETKLDELFNAVIHPKDYQVPLTVPMRLRNLPPSFFQQPEKGSKSASHSRESSADGSSYPPGGGSDTPSQPQTQQQLPSGLQINHPRAHSSPASLQQAYNKSISSSHHQHPRQRSYGDLLDDDDNTPLPLGWEKAKTSAGQTYFLNHLTQTTTWVDPRKKLNSGSISASVDMQNINDLPKGWERATTLEGEVYFINHIDRTTSWLDPRIPAHLQTPPTVSCPTQQSISALQNPSQVQANNSVNLVRHLPTQSIKLPPSIAAAVSSTTGSLSNQMNIQQRQQNLRVQSLEMEREQLRLRQQEIMRQEMLLRQSLGEKLSLATSPTGSTPDLPPVSTSLDSFLEGGTDFHSRQESADSGLGLGTNYSLPHTPEDFLSNMDDVDDRQSNDLGLDLQTNLDLGDDHMDTDDLVPSLQEELNADILSDVEALLAANKDSVLTWL
ncbi:transcriptional coactivator YAP1-A-like isoform X2 [Stegodyphus dumicola]|uniref:transcriptional coactivator YAP1-A-like isoform X2 n=1 Tax=Stegodyphus dumicola TaxID=202533 RepID=UPI0015AC9380|nr:transcriptional coactivator YAP1-A-like isoform X2 [Stegodyphus dumicola]